MMTKAEISSKFSYLLNNPGQILLDSIYPIELYVTNNYQDHKAILIVTDKIVEVKSSKSIVVSTLKRPDESYVTIFQLIDSELSNEFIELLWNIYCFTFNISDKNEALKEFINAFKRWQLLLDAGKVYMSESDYKGLFGELQFIDDNILNTSVESIMDAWTSSSDNEIDFRFDNTWYEIKCIYSSKNYVNISSIDQLDQKINGFLMIYELEDHNEKKCNINILCESIRSKINSIEYHEVFNSKLLKRGYVESPYYDKMNYKIVNKSKYIVNDTFPCIRRREVNKAIKDVSYEIYISEISDWRID